MFNITLIRAVCYAYAMKTFNAIFTNNRLALIASLLGGWLLLAGISAYYDFSWASALIEP
jgi:hypothetical protein